jgi:hypothetical protein
MFSLPGFSGCFCSYRKPNFPAVSGSYLPGFSSRICSYWQPNFPPVSGSYLPGFSGLISVTGSRIFRPCLWLLAGIFWPYLSWHQKAGIFRPNLLFLAGIFWP